ncbi:MAG TPA: isomerizing glutamine--fructose-6-phosphate transaminase, partial [Candidatus Omnitrophota bacterium]|nr:isomerizing glutamine--fructose-6-phosphate transaminase [Candidatus Omnitrophota bacterium]
MCGIVGYIGNQNAIPILVKGLEHLEYRGYDSAGIACLNHHRGSLFVIKEKGKLGALKEQLEGIDVQSHIGIGHTRWATHGEPSRTNAHPHLDNSGRISIIHNGIIENYSSLKKELRQKGYRFYSETDTEVAVNMISSCYKKKGDFVEAARNAVQRLHGFYAFVILNRDEPDKLFVFKRSNPIAIGIGHGENFIGSDVTAFLPYTNRVIYLEDDEYAIVMRESVEIFSIISGKAVHRKPMVIDWNISQAQKGGYPHFMLKEIFEQPRVLEELISKHVSKSGDIVFDTIHKAIDRRLKNVKKVFLISCGTAYHAGLVANYAIGKYARIPAEA